MPFLVGGMGAQHPGWGWERVKHKSSLAAGKGNLILLSSSFLNLGFKTRKPAGVTGTGLVLLVSSG